MQELNREILQEAISKLPKYEAPPSIWSNIEEALIAEEQDQQITATIPQLPSYKAPASIWENIESTLDKAPVSGNRPTLFIRLGRLAVAASFLGFAIWIGWQQFAPSQEDYAIVYTEEEVSDFNYELNLEEDEAAFSTMLTHFKTSIVAQQHEEYNTLLAEYEELNDAKKELTEMIDNYGKDPNIISQISDLEHERTKVIKKMAALI